MSWLFSQALVEEYSAGTSLDGEPSSQLNVMPTPHKFWRSDKTIESCDHSRFGLTSQVLTDDHGTELLMSFLVAFRARISAQQAEAQGSKASAPVFGSTCSASFARYAQKECSWKTAQLSLLGDSELFLEAWPRWGSMRNGESFLRPIPALPICESASGLWQTPVADDSVARKEGKWNSRGEPKLSAQVKLIPTLCHRDYRSGKGKKQTERGRNHGQSLPEFMDGLLNPDWTEWLMGWPIGWTELKPLEMDKFREWQQQHGGFSANET